MKKYLLLGAAALALATYVARAQIGSLVAQTLTGRECWQATQFAAAMGTGAGPGIFVCGTTMQNSQGAVQITATTGTVNATLAQGADYIFTTALTGGITFNFPPMPVPNGWIIEIVNGTTANFTQAITVTAQTNQTLVGTAAQTLNQNVSSEWRFVATTITNGVPTVGIWYQLR